MIFVCLLACTMGGFLIGGIVGAVLGKDLAIAETEKKEELRTETLHWRDDLGEWK